MDCNHKGILSLNNILLFIYWNILGCSQRNIFSPVCSLNMISINSIHWWYWNVKCNWWCNTNGVNHYLWCKCFIIVKQILYLIKEMKRANPLLVNSGMQWCKKMYCHSYATKRNTYSKTKLRKVNIAFFKVLFKIIWLPIIFDKNDFRFQIFQSKLTSFLVITILDRGYNFFM